MRELENVLRRALVVAKGDAILLSDLPAEITGQGPAAGAAVTVSLPAGEGSASDIAAMARQLFQWARRDPKLKVIPAVERELVIQALKETDGNQSTPPNCSASRAPRCASGWRSSGFSAS